MPAHDWSRVDAGIFHAFHVGWISTITEMLNTGLLPEEYYALPEQQTDRRIIASADEPESPLLSLPRVQVTAEADFYRFKQNVITIRHTSDDDVTAIVEIVSPGNKSSRFRMNSFVEKTSGLLSRHIHLLIVDVNPPGPRDPNGIHSEIWELVGGTSYQPSADKLLTQVAYEANDVVSAYVVPFAVGESLTDMPLFLKRKGCVHVPLEQTYQTAFAVQPRKWKAVLER